MTMRLLPRNDEEGWTPYAWTVYLFFFLLAPVLQPRTSPAEWASTIAGLIIFLALYFRGYWVNGRSLLLIIAAITLLGAVYYPFNMGAGTFFIYAGAFAGRLHRTRQAVTTLLLIELALAIEIWRLGVPATVWFWPVVFTVLVGAINIHYSQVGRSNKRLRLAQDEIEHLAKVAERERIARDLHDLLGHTLSLIILKSELASKLSEREPARARDEIRDVERISREALTEVRQAVRGYRQGGLEQELSGAREMLRAASIECRERVESVHLLPAQEAILSLALREAVTNVVRHSRASHCSIELEQQAEDIRLVVADDGRGGSDDEGYGLMGMRERISAVGGAMSRDGSHGTTLTITLPASRPARTTALERSA